jgi:GTP-binding protein SAR1
MVDAADRERLGEAKKELDKLLEMPELMQTPIVVFGNKVDKMKALNEIEFREALCLSGHSTYGKVEKNPNSRPIEVFMCSVTKRVGY